MRTIALLICTLALAACQSLSGYQRQTGPTPIPELGRVMLNQPLAIRADYASVYLQAGKVRPTNTAAEYQPHCILELRTLSPVERTVAPDTFTVTGIHRDRFMAGLAGLQLAVLALGGGDYNPVMSITTLMLHSDRQPEVSRLRCQQLDEPFWARHVSRAQMQEALGDIMTLLPLP